MEVEVDANLYVLVVDMMLIGVHKSQRNLHCIERLHPCYFYVIFYVVLETGAWPLGVGDMMACIITNQLC